MKTIVLILTIIVSSSAFASSLKNGKVIKLEYGPTHGDTIHVQIEGEQTGKPACATNTKFNFSFISSSKIGEKIFMGLLAAQKSDATVDVSGRDICTVNFRRNTEDLRWIQVY